MYRDRLPQVGSGLFVTDGGIETTLIYRRGLELPAFAAFDAALKARLPRANVLGGCCGTDDGHVAAICTAWREEPAPART